MGDRQFRCTLSGAVAAVAWLVAGALILLGFAVDDIYAETGTFIAMIGGCLTVRTFVVQHDQSIRAAQRDWFELGRDAEAGGVRRLR